MLFRLGRAHRRFLGLAGEWSADLEDSAMPIDTVVISAQVAQCFQSQLYVPGAFRSEPIFGHRDDGTLHAVYAAPAGYLTWKDHDPAQPFALDPSYILGWTDALQTVHSAPIDWVGTWLSFPDTRAADRATEQLLIEQARADLLSEYNTALLFVGWQRHELEIHSYSGFADDQIRTLTVKWASDENISDN